MKKIIIADAIFDLFPDFYRGIVLVKDVMNQKSYKRVRKLLRGQIEARVDMDTASDARLTAWDQAHQKFGSDPTRYLPAIRSLPHCMAHSLMSPARLTCSLPAYSRS